MDRGVGVNLSRMTVPLNQHMCYRKCFATTFVIFHHFRDSVNENCLRNNCSIVCSATKRRTSFHRNDEFQVLSFSVGH